MKQAARANVVDPERLRGSNISIRGASRSELSTSAGSSTGPRTRRNAIASVLREANGAAPLTTKVMDVWREFIDKRYDKTTKFLNLEVRTGLSRPFPFNHLSRAEYAYGRTAQEELSHPSRVLWRKL